MPLCGGGLMEVNRPEVVAEVEAAFARYEAALVGNDLGVLDDSFWDSALTVRFGVGENLYGMEAIRAFRTARLSVGLQRTLFETVITTFGTDFATASTLFRRDGMVGAVGRQMQSWVRMADGWRVVAATVSVIKPS